MVNTYDKGDRIRLKGRFTINDIEVDPTYVMILVRRPSNLIDSYAYSGTAFRSDTGSYYVDINLDDDGQWWYRFVCSGSVVAAGEDYFLVRMSEF